MSKFNISICFLIISILLFGCSKSDEQLKKEISERVIGYHNSLFKAKNPSNSKNDVINEIKSFLKPGNIGETRVQQYYNQRQFYRDNWNMLKTVGYENKHEISKILLNENKDEAKVTSLFLEKGINCSGSIGKEFNSILIRNDEIYVIIDGIWYRDVEKPVEAKCEFVSQVRSAVSVPKK